MKTLFLLLFLTPILCLGQSKKDLKIIVTVADTTNLSDRIARAFQLNEFSIDNKDAGFVSTREKSINAPFPTEVKVRALISGNQITFTGERRMNISVYNQPAAFERISFSGVKGSVARISWNELDKIAKLLGDQITYSK